MTAVMAWVIRKEESHITGEELHDYCQGQISMYSGTWLSLLVSHSYPVYLGFLIHFSIFRNLSPNSRREFRNMIAEVTKTDI